MSLSLMGYIVWCGNVQFSGRRHKKAVRVSSVFAGYLRFKSGSKIFIISEMTRLSLELFLCTFISGFVLHACEDSARKDLLHAASNTNPSPTASCEIALSIQSIIPTISSFPHNPSPSTSLSSAPTSLDCT
jgi:hypothetical protein